jgi:SAM-dependent methyltransferase
MLIAAEHAVSPVRAAPPPRELDPARIELPELFVRAVASRAKVSSAPHNLYKYPARFAPEFAREAIRAFSQPGDLVLDCFHGGGTTLVEAVAQGRRAVGYDISSLACFLARVKTTPLTVHDERLLLSWSEGLTNLNDAAGIACWDAADTDDGYYRRNLPPNALRFFANVIAALPRLPRARQRQFARLILLAVGQRALDCKTELPSIPAMRAEFRQLLGESLREFRAYTWRVAKNLRIPPGSLAQQRTIIHASSESCSATGPFSGEKAALVVTSPPYPGVHMLYHRWQLLGRREMPAPFLLADCRDGDGISFYSLGCRHEERLTTYYDRLTKIYQAVRGCLKPGGLVVQMVAFNRPEWQLPAFLQAMTAAGYHQVLPDTQGRGYEDGFVWRAVPGRRWYAAANKRAASGNEVVLIHRALNG